MENVNAEVEKFLKLDPTDEFQKVDLESSRYRTKYVDLNNIFTDPDRHTKYLFFFNMKSMISSFYYKVEKRFGEDQKWDLRMKMQIAVSVMNTVAHYIHYAKKHLRGGYTAIIYMPEYKDYVKYKEIVDRVTNFTRFLPQVHTIPMTIDSIPHFHSHAITAITHTINKVAQKKGQKLSVIMVGPKFIEMQAMRFCNDFHVIEKKRWDIVNKRSYPSIFDVDSYYIGKFKMDESLVYSFKYRYELMDAFSAIGLVTNMAQKALDIPPEGVKIPHGHISTRVAKIENIIVNSVGENSITLCDRIGKELFPNCYDAYFTALRSIEYDCRSDVLPFVTQLLPTWTAKLKDTKIATSLNESLYHLNIDSLNVDWLLEEVDANQ